MRTICNTDCGRSPTRRPLAFALTERSGPLIHHAPGNYPSGKEGDVLTVEFTVLGIPCLDLSGGPAFRPSEARLG